MPRSCSRLPAPGTPRSQTGWTGWSAGSPSCRRPRLATKPGRLDGNGAQRTWTRATRAGLLRLGHRPRRPAAATAASPPLRPAVRRPPDQVSPPRAPVPRAPVPQAPLPPAAGHPPGARRPRPRPSRPRRLCPRLRPRPAVRWTPPRCGRGGRRCSPPSSASAGWRGCSSATRRSSRWPTACSPWPSPRREWRGAS